MRSHRFARRLAGYTGAVAIIAIGGLTACGNNASNNPPSTTTKTPTTTATTSAAAVAPTPPAAPTHINDPRSPNRLDPAAPNSVTPAPVTPPPFFNWPK